MVSVIISYGNGDDKLISHVIKISYNNHGKIEEITGAELVTHLFPISSPLWFHTDDEIFCVNNVGLHYIDVKKE